MDTIKGQAIGDVHVIVYETDNGSKVFQVIVNNDNISHIADIIEDSLVKY